MPVATSLISNPGPDQYRGKYDCDIENRPSGRVVNYDDDHYYELDARKHTT